VAPAITPEPGVTCAWHIFPVLLAPGVDRAAFRARLRDAGVQTSVHYPPLHLTTAFSLASPPSLPLTEDYALRTVTLPLFPHMSESHQQRVVAAASAALDHLTR
jgi:dTDP-4-amino-4,6-dideoxygalactose transaminase